MLQTQLRAKAESLMTPDQIRKHIDQLQMVDVWDIAAFQLLICVFVREYDIMPNSIHDYF